MAAQAPFLLIPGLNCSGRLFEKQVPALWRYAPVMVCDAHRADSVQALAERIVSTQTKEIAEMQAAQAQLGLRP